MSLTLHAAAGGMGACIGVMALLPVGRWACRRLGAVDDPLRDDRRVHREPVVRGVGFLVALVVGALWWALGGPWLGSPALLAGLGIMVAVGLIDDVCGTRPLVKLLAQGAAVGLALGGAGLLPEAMTLPLLGHRLDHPIFVWAFYLLLGTGMVNALNLIDGLDGLASGVGLVICLGLAVLAFDAGNTTVLLGASILGGALLGFLVWNAHPAKVFLGDAGSLSLGFGITVLSLALLHPPGGVGRPYSLGVPLLLLVLPWADCVFVMTRRLLHGKHPFKGDRTHIHHRLLELGLPQGDATLILIALATGLAVLAVLLAQAPRDTLFLMIVICIQTIIGGVRLFGRTSLYRLLRYRTRSWRSRRARWLNTESTRARLVEGFALPALGALAIGVLLASCFLGGMPGWRSFAALSMPLLMALLILALHSWRVTQALWVPVFITCALLAAASHLHVENNIDLRWACALQATLAILGVVAFIIAGRGYLWPLLIPRPGELALLLTALSLPLLASAGRVGMDIGWMGLGTFGSYVLVKCAALSLATRSVFRPLDTATPAGGEVPAMGLAAARSPISPQPRGPEASQEARSRPTEPEAR